MIELKNNLCNSVNLTSAELFLRFLHTSICAVTEYGAYEKRALRS